MRLSFKKENINRHLTVENFRIAFVVGAIVNYLAVDDMRTSVFLALSLVLIFFAKRPLINIKDNIGGESTILVCFVLLMLSMSISSAFAYHSAIEAFSEMGYRFVFVGFIGIFLLSLEKTSFSLMIVKYSFVLATVFELSKRVFLIGSPDVSIVRTFGTQAEILFPIIFSMLLFSRQKVFFLLLSILIVWADLLTGARGSYGAIAAEAFVVLIFYAYIKKFDLMKIFKFTFLSVAVAGIFIFIVHNNFSFVEKTLNRGGTSGRDVIVKERFPLITQNFNPIIGLGFGHKQYNHFLLDHNAPRTFGIMHEGEFYYWDDEPYLLSEFYRLGVLGVAALLVFYFVLMKRIVTVAAKSENYEYTPILVAIFASFVGIFVVRGLAEYQHSQYVLFFMVLYLFFRPQAAVK